MRLRENADLLGKNDFAAPPKPCRAGFRGKVPWFFAGLPPASWVAFRPKPALMTTFPVADPVRFRSIWIRPLDDKAKLFVQ
jgi:hypothetical protein